MHAVDETQLKEILQSNIEHDQAVQDAIALRTLTQGTKPFYATGEDDHITETFHTFEGNLTGMLKNEFPMSFGTITFTVPDHDKKIDGLFDSLISAGGIGNVNSNDKGTGARFNSGKVPYEVLPLELLLDWIDLHQYPHENLNHGAFSVLDWLGEWQKGNDDALFEALNCAVIEAGLPGFAEAARVFKHVTERKVNPYPMWNWMKGMPWSVPYGCAIRHLNAEMCGQTHDPETGLLHRGHTICNLIMLLLYAKTFTEGDNRPPGEFL